MRNSIAVTITGLVITIVLCYLWCLFVDYSLKPVVTTLVNEYNKPDTTITIHNGIADTLIKINK